MGKARPQSPVEDSIAESINEARIKINDLHQQIAEPVSGAYVMFTLAGKSRSGKTALWNVHNAKDYLDLGVVYWKTEWRRYVYVPEEGTIYDHVCLQELAAFVSRQTELHNELCKLQRIAEELLSYAAEHRTSQDQRPE